jgi:Peptidase C39 family
LRSSINGRRIAGSALVVTPHLQSTASECSLACLVMVVEHYGLRLDMRELRQRFSLLLKGATLAQLIRYVLQLKVSSPGRTTREAAIYIVTVTLARQTIDAYGQAQPLKTAWSWKPKSCSAGTRSTIGIRG